MAENSSFRSAFMGFNRDDVISYITELMEKISAAEKEADALREKALDLERDSAGFQERIDALQKERDDLAEDCARLERERDEQTKRSTVLERKCAEFDRLSKSTEVKLGAAMLDAKRFSEMLVQEANDRAGAVYQDAFESLSVSSAEVRGIEKQMKEFSELFEKSMGEARRSIQDLNGRMAAFIEAVKDNGAKFDYRSSFADGEKE